MGNGVDGPGKSGTGYSTFVVNTEVDVSISINQWNPNRYDSFNTGDQRTGLPGNVSGPETGLATSDGQGGAVPLTPQQRSELSLIGVLCQRNPPCPGLQSRLASFATNVGENCHNIDPMLFVQMVLRESYQQKVEDMRYFAEKVQYYTELKKQQREEIKNVNKRLAELAAADGDAQLDPPFPMHEWDGNFAGVTEPQAQAVATGTDPSVLSGGAVQEWDGLNPPCNPAPTGAQRVFVTAPGGYAVAFIPEGNRVVMYDATGKLLKEISGDPHVDDDGDGDWDWHFGASSTFILPDGTKVACNCKEKEAGSGIYYVEGIDVLSGTYRGSTGLGPNGEERQGGLLEDRADFDAKNADFAAGRSDAGLFLVQPEGATLMKMADDTWQPVSAKSWEDYKNSKSIDTTGDSQSVSSNAVKTALNDGSVLSRPAGCANTKAELEAYKKSLEENLNTAGDDATLANYDLQNCTQQQTQLMQLMSGLAKMFHETLMGIARKLGG